MNLRNFFIILFLVTGIIIGGRAFYISLSSTYSITPTQNFTEFDSKINETFSQLEDIESEIESTKVTGLEDVDMFVWFVKGSYEAIKLGLKLPRIYSSLITTAFKILHIPDWVFSVTMGIITVAVIFAVISIAQKQKV